MDNADWVVLSYTVQHNIENMLVPNTETVFSQGRMRKFGWTHWAVYAVYCTYRYVKKSYYK